MGSVLSGFEQSSDATSVSAIVEGQGRIVADVLVCADGAQSASRRRLLPDVASQYAGYVAWRGALDEDAAPADLVAYFDDAFTFSEARSGGHILVYFIPGEGADSTPGKRRLNWVWYVKAAATERQRLLIDRDGRSHHSSLGQGEASPSSIRSLVELAHREVHPMLAKLVAATPEPFLQTIVDVAVPRMVFGRTCLLGDAAFVVRPHTAGAAAKAARDASVLAMALKRAGQNVDAGLGSFEDMQLEYGREMVEYGIALGNRWAA
jgi:2-polyprenyl-6-methoxyphenol hydroxylase-like FAD-dependent oxidoreductase